MTGISDADTLGKLTYMGRRLIDRVQKVSVLKITAWCNVWAAYRVWAVQVVSGGFYRYPDKSSLPGQQGLVSCCFYAG